MKRRSIVIAFICLVVTILYMVFPIDVIPDLIAVVGWIDDLIVGVVGLIGMLANIRLAFRKADCEMCETGVIE